MKVRHVWLGQAASLLLFASSTWAQTSITMYGRLDGGFEDLNHVATPQGRNSNRWSAEGETGVPACGA